MGLNSTRNRVPFFLTFFIIFIQFIGNQDAFAYEKGTFFRHCLDQIDANQLSLHRFLIDSHPFVQLWSNENKEGSQNSYQSRPTLSFIDQRTLLRDLMTEYVNTYIENQESFDPYHHEQLTTWKAKGTMLYRHLCQNSDFKPTCKEHKDKIISFFENHLKNIDAIKPLPHLKQNNSTYLGLFNQAIIEIRQKYSVTRAAINNEITSTLFKENTLDTSIHSAQDYNHQLQNILSQPNLSEMNQHYKKTYLKHARSFPGKILFTKTMLNRIEGNFFEIHFVDLILAVEEITKELRNDFQKLLKENPLIMKSLDIEETAEKEERLKLEPKNIELVNSCNQSIEQWFHSSNISQIFASEEIFSLIEALNITDIETIRFLTQNQLQRAMWRLRELALTDKAQALENWINHNILADDQVEKSTLLGGGITTTKLIFYPHFAKGVYKPKPRDHKRYHQGLFDWVDHKYQDLMDSLGGDYRKEIAAYKIDRLINLNLVPLTKKVDLADGVGSLQLFIDQASTARIMNEVDINKPIQSGHWSSPSGRALLHRNALLFDWLIDNHDRNVDNYLFQDDGQVILIDHGWTFLCYHFHSLSHEQIKKMIPTRTIYQNIKILAQDHALVDRELSPLLNSIRLKLFKERLNFFVKNVEELILKNGENDVFSKEEEGPPIYL